MSMLLPQTLSIDGCKNIWVIKAPDSSCGIGIKLHARLEEILQSERGEQRRSQSDLLCSVSSQYACVYAKHPCIDL